MTCDTNQPQGANKDCNGIQEKILNFLIQKRGSGGLSTTEVESISTWEALVNPALELYRFVGGFAADPEKSGGDPVVVQNTSTGANTTQRYNPPTYSAHIRTNDCDYAEMLANWDNGLYEVWFEKESSIKGTKRYTGDQLKLFGMTARVNVNPFNDSVADDSSSDYMITIDFQKPKEFKVPYTFAKPEGFEVAMEEILPVGYALNIQDYSDISALELTVNERCGDPAEGLTAGDFFFNDGVNPALVTESSPGTYVFDATGKKTVQVVVGATTLAYVSNVENIPS